jgi:hypothetical protein
LIRGLEGVTDVGWAQETLLSVAKSKQTRAGRKRRRRRRRRKTKKKEKV